MPHANRWVTLSFGIAVLVAGGIPLSGISDAQTIEPPPELEASAATGPGAEQVEVLARGPVHEAFARPVAHDPLPGPVAPVSPSDPIDEIPPDTRPEGDDIAWIPGYWSWDEQRNDFIWISGVWRKTPPDREWVAGYWQEQDGSWQWVAGFWGPSGADSLSYVEPPPKSLEQGPNSPAPSSSHCWIPGCWVLESDRYHWQPGYWQLYRAGWVWIPAHYMMVSGGCILVDGYWDYILTRRGMLFAPVYPPLAVTRMARFRYVPRYPIRMNNLFLHLFVHTGSHHYCYGDYYAATYVGRSIYPWHDTYRFGHYYDPSLVYSSAYFHRHGINYVHRLRNWHNYFVHHEKHRPPRVLKEQSSFVARYHGTPHVDHSLLVGSMAKEVGRRRANEKFVRIDRAEQARFSQDAAASRVENRNHRQRVQRAESLRRQDQKRHLINSEDLLKNANPIKPRDLAKRGNQKSSRAGLQSSQSDPRKSMVSGPRQAKQTQAMLKKYQLPARRGVVSMKPPVRGHAVDSLSGPNRLNTRPPVKSTRPPVKNTRPPVVRNPTAKHLKMPSRAGHGPASKSPQRKASPRSIEMRQRTVTLKKSSVKKPTTIHRRSSPAGPRSVVKAPSTMRQRSAPAPRRTESHTPKRRSAPVGSRPDKKRSKKNS